MRPAIAVPIPTRSGRPFVLLDSGANADARPEHLLQFAHMGVDLRRGDPRDPAARGAAALDRRGAGEGKPADARGARAARPARLGFAGNAESRDLLEGAADVVVCDGFTGNIALKLLEGTIKTLLDALREEILAHAAREGRRPADPARGAGGCGRLDPDTYGGAYLLGLRGLAVIAHGNSSPHGDRERDPARRARGRARRRRPPRRTLAGAPVAGRCMIGAL